MKIVNLLNHRYLDNDFYFYAETAFIHEGDKQYLLKLIEHAKKYACDGIKFQMLLQKENSYSPKLKSFERLDPWIFQESEWREILSYAKNLDLDVIILPIDIPSVDFCTNNRHLFDAIEIHSITLNDYYLLKKIGQLKNVPVILGIGGRTLDEIDYALKYLKENIPVLMLGIQNYPTDILQTNLIKIEKLKQLYPFIIGYADHTNFNQDYKKNMMQFAYLLGARIFEIHLTLEKGKPRIDYEAAVGGEDIVLFHQEMNNLISILGNKTGYTLNEAELLYRSREKKIVYVSDLKKGSIITEKSLIFKVTPDSSDFSQKDIFKIIGNVLTKDVSADDVVRLTDYEPPHNELR